MDLDKKFERIMKKRGGHEATLARVRLKVLHHESQALKDVPIFSAYHDIDSPVVLDYFPGRWHDNRDTSSDR